MTLHANQLILLLLHQNPGRCTPFSGFAVALNLQRLKLDLRVQSLDLNLNPFNVSEKGVAVVKLGQKLSGGNPLAFRDKQLGHPGGSRLPSGWCRQLKNFTGRLELAEGSDGFNPTDRFQLHRLRFRF